MCQAGFVAVQIGHELNQSQSGARSVGFLPAFPLTLMRFEGHHPFSMLWNHDLLTWSQGLSQGSGKGKRVVKSAHKVQVVSKS